MFFNKSPFRFQELRTQIKAELLSLGFEPILPFAKHCYIVVFQGTKYRWEIYLDRTKAEVSVINNSTNKLIKVNGKDDVREVPYSNKKAPLTHLEEILGEALFTRFQRVA